MMRHDRSAGLVVAFSRGWQVVQEVDLMRIVADHASVAALCDALEKCADALPARPDEATAARLCAGLERVTAASQADEWALATLLRSIATDDLPVALLRLIDARRSANAGYAQELLGALRPGDGDQHTDPHVLGYMLRCFFTGCRSSIELEQLAILAVAHHRLTPDGRALLVDALSRRAA
ncbi:MAG: hypothetical protein K0S66_2570 [Sphingomonas sp.]|nr:hypothetical protein [Sphingomonas sp.]